MAHSSVVINRKPPRLIPQTFSLNFDAIRSFASITDATVGITDTWSLMVWAKAKNNPANIASKGLMSIVTRNVLTANQITMEGDGDDDVNTDLRMRIYRADGQFLQLKRWLDVQKSGTDTWIQYVLTWGGVAGNTGSNPLELKLYTQGIDRGPANGSGTRIDNPSSDGPGVTDTARGVSVGIAGTLIAGARWDGNIYSAAVYDSILGGDEIAAMYNNGDGVNFDMEKNSGAYVSSGNLVHYFRLGVGTTELEFGTDNTANINDLSMEHRTENSGQTFDADDLNADVPFPILDTNTASIDFNGTDEYLHDNIRFDPWTDFTRTYLISFKPTAVPGLATLFREATTTGDPIAYFEVDLTTSGRIQLYATDPAFTLMKEYRVDTAYVVGEWSNLVITHDPTGQSIPGQDGEWAFWRGGESIPIINYYTDLDFAPVGSEPTQFAIASRRFPEDRHFNGLVYTFAAWDRILSESEIQLISNGNGRVKDLNVSQGVYSNSNLHAYFRFGEDTGNIGINYATGGPAWDLMNDASNITADDIIADTYPGKT
jgi:hypothetical protein